MKKIIVTTRVPENIHKQVKLKLVHSEVYGSLQDLVLTLITDWLKKK